MNKSFIQTFLQDLFFNFRYSFLDNDSTFSYVYLNFIGGRYLRNIFHYSLDTMMYYKFLI